MSDETERLATEAERHRGRLDETLDRLKERLSVGQIVDELSGYVRQGQGAEIVQNLNRQVRDNPLALGLVGAGVAWLMFGQGPRHDDRSLPRDRIGGGSAAGRATSYGESHPRTDPGTGSSGPGARVSGTTSPGPGLRDRAGNIASGATQAASAAAGSIGSASASAASGLSDAARSAGSSVADATGRASDAVGRTLHDTQDALYGVGDSLSRGGSYASERLGDLGSRARRGFLDTLQDEPLVLGAVVLAIGAAVGASLPATRRENELFGEARDRLAGEAAEYGREAVDRAAQAAGEIYKAGSEEAERQGLKPDAGSGSGTVAERVSAVADKVTQAAGQEARKEGLA